MAHDSLTRRQLVKLTGAGAAASTAGCLNFGGGGNGGGGGGTGDPAELPPVHVLTDYNNDAWQTQWEDKLKPAFQEQTGINLRLEYAGFSGQNENRLATLLQSGDPPALQSSTMDQVGSILAADALTPVTETIDEAIIPTVGEQTVEAYRDDSGDHYQISHGTYTGVFVYREDVYEQLGLEVPTSFQGVLDNAKAIDESDMDIRGYGLAGKKVGKSQDEFQTYLANMGASELRYKKPGQKQGVELWFPKDEMVRLLNYFQDLAKYSPPPSGMGWSESLSGWAAGEYAQGYHLNAWPAGVASGVSEKIAKNTGIAPMPLWEEGGISKEDSWLSTPTLDGWHLFKNANNTPGGRRFLKWLYGDKIERTAGLYEAEPTRFLPAYEKIIDSEAYQSYDYWQQWPKHLEMMKYCQDTIIPEYYSNVEHADVETHVPEALYYYRFFFIGSMVNQVVVAGKNPEKAWQEAKEQAKERLREARQKFSG